MDTGTRRRTSWRAAITGNVLNMGLVSLFTDFSSEMIYPLLTVFLAGLSPTRAAISLGLMEGIAETTASLLKLVSGRLSDRLGKRKLLVLLGYGLSTVCRPLMGAASAAWNVVALRFLDRIGKGVRTSPRDALIGDSVGPDRRGLAFSFHRAMDHTGAVLGPVVAALILVPALGPMLWAKHAQVMPAEMRAMRWLFALALLPGLAAMAVLFFRVKEIAPTKAPAPPAEETVGRWALPRRFFLFVGIVTLFALGNSSDLFLLLYARTRFELGILQILALWVALHLSKIVWSIPGGMLSDRFGRRPLIVAGWIVYSLVYLGMALVAAEWQFWALFLVYGCYYGLTEGAEKALVADFVPSKRRGSAFGIYHGAVGLAALPASLVFGVLWVALDRVRPGLGPVVAFSIGAALAGLAAVLMVIFLSTTRQERAA